MTNIPNFPTRHLSPVWGDWIDATAARLGAPPDYVAAGLFASVAIATGANIVAEPVPGWREPLHLWLCLAGGPRTGKSRTLDAFAALQPADGGSVWQHDLAAWSKAPRNLAAPSVAGALRPGALAGIGDGLAARFLYFWPERPPWLSLADRRITGDGDVTARLGRIAALGGDAVHPVVLPLTEEALAAFDAFCAANYEELGEEEGRAIDWLANARNVAARLALALTLLDWSAADEAPPPVAIEMDAVERAIALYDDYFMPQAMRALERSAEMRRLAPVERALRWLSETNVESVSQEEIRRKALSYRVDSQGAARVIAELEGRGVLCPIEPERRRGRPSPRWCVQRASLRKSDNPKFDGDQAPRRQAAELVAFDLPEVNSTADLKPAARSLMRQAAEGKLSVANCQKMTNVLKTHAEIIDVAEMEGRLKHVETIAHKVKHLTSLLEKL